MKLYIKRKSVPVGVDAYCLVDEAGEILPHQVDTTLHSSPDAMPTFTVTFRAGDGHLQVIDEREES